MAGAALSSKHNNLSPSPVLLHGGMRFYNVVQLEDLPDLQHANTLSGHLLFLYFSMIHMVECIALVIDAVMRVCD